jgi:hypothetical protein
MSRFASVESFFVDKRTTNASGAALAFDAWCMRHDQHPSALGVSGLRLERNSSRVLSSASLPLPLLQAAAAAAAASTS